MYTIKLNGATQAQAEKFRQTLEKKLTDSKTFKAQLGPVTAFSKGSYEGTRQAGFGFGVGQVRLRKAKPYCGNHPGECPVIPGQKSKPKYTFLEWEDWVKFHSFINSALGKKSADVFSRPHDALGIMWMRRGLKARKTYSWDEHPTLYGRAIRVWDRGVGDHEY